MNEELNLQNFNDVRAIYNVLGNICNNTELLREDNVHLKKEDFMQRLHKIIFSAVNNIAFNTSGDKVTMVSAKDIDNYLSSYPTQYKVWNDQKGFDYVKQITEHCNDETFHQSYDRVKKMAILREYQQMGFDVSDIYEWNSDDFLAREKSLKQIDKMKMQEIFEHFTLKNLRIKDDFNIETEVKQFKAGQNISQLLDRAKEGMGYGYPTPNGMENSAFGGMIKGKFLLRSASTGGMKTSLAIADMIKVATPKYYKDNEWHYNGVSVPSLFISTELEEDELNQLALSNLTGISRGKIKYGTFNKEERDLLEKAGEILAESPFYLVHIPDFSVEDIESIIERHVLDYDVQYVAFDYIQSTPKLMRTTSELYGQKQNEPQVLLYLSSRLKTIAEKYNIFLESSTQLNKNRKEDDKKDADSIYGSSAIANKIDTGILLFRVNDNMREKVSSFIEERGFGTECNFARFIYKNRNGQPDIILWSHMDFSTVRETPLFATDYDYNIAEKIEDLHFEYQENKTERDIEYEKEYSREGNGTFGEVAQKVDYDLDF